jgi:hypothetical protein
LAKNIYKPNYFSYSLKENISNVNLKNLKAKSLKQHSDLLIKNKNYRTKTSNNRRKQQF